MVSSSFPSWFKLQPVCHWQHFFFLCILGMQTSMTWCFTVYIRIQSGFITQIIKKHILFFFKLEFPECIFPPNVFLQYGNVLIMAFQKQWLGRDRDIEWFILRNWLTHCGGWQVQNLQSRLTGWRTREELLLQFASKGSLLAEFLFAWGDQSLFC